jgi:hypothetical protein
MSLTCFWSVEIAKAKLRFRTDSIGKGSILENVRGCCEYGLGSVGYPILNCFYQTTHQRTTDIRPPVGGQNPPRGRTSHHPRMLAEIGLILKTN